jgi:hypothetical protein
MRPPRAALAHVASSHEQSLSCAHINACRCPPSAAHAQVLAPNWQPCSRAHTNTSRCPPSAAKSQVRSSSEQPCSRAHRNTSRCPPLAAEQVDCICQGQAFASAQTNCGRDWENERMETRGPLALPPARGNPARITAVQTALPVRPSMPRSRGFSRSSTPFLKRSRKYSSSARNGGRGGSLPWLTPAPSLAAAAGGRGGGGARTGDAARIPASKPTACPTQDAASLVSTIRRVPTHTTNPAPALYIPTHRHEGAAATWPHRHRPAAVTAAAARTVDGSGSHACRRRERVTCTTATRQRRAV